MRLFSTSTVARSMTSSPRIVTTRALVSATRPRGRAASKSKPMAVFCGAGARSSLASARSTFSRLCSWKFSPAVHCTDLLSGHHASQSPETEETGRTGTPVSVELSLTVLPTLGKGAT